MKTQIDVKSLVLGALLSTGIVLSIALARTAAVSRAMEYKTVSGAVMPNLAHFQRLDDEINRETTQGWEFVSASSVENSWAFALLRREKK
jgi:hypothetical protein